MTRQPDQVDQHTQAGIRPHRDEWRVSLCVDLLQGLRERYHLVPRERPESARPCLDGGDADEVQHDEGHECEEDGGAAAHDVEEDLGDGLAVGGADEGGGVAHAEDDDEVEHEAQEVG